MVWGWEVEITGWAAEVQDGAAGSRKGVEGSREGCVELLWVVPRIVLCNDLLQTEGQGGVNGSDGSHPTRTSHLGVEDAGEVRATLSFGGRTLAQLLGPWVIWARPQQPQCVCVHRVRGLARDLTLVALRWVKCHWPEHVRCGSWADMPEAPLAG